jgi:hypothetical protein
VSRAEIDPTLTPADPLRRFLHTRTLPMHVLRLVGAAGVLLTAALVGCSSGPVTGEVRGKVTFKGQPVTEGTVTFLNPAGKGDAEAKLGTDGSYALPAPVVVGDYVVIVTPPTEMKDTDPGKSPPAPVEKAAPNIPRKYRAQGTTTLKAPVKQGPNVFDFDLLP